MRCALQQIELAHVTRVATLGELTASIAHEVNQPLGALVNNAGAEKRRPPRWTLAVVARTAIGRYASGSDPPNLSKGFRRPLPTRREILRRNRAGRGASSAAGVPPGYRPDTARAPI
jgi:signal transduction histidine kinase